MSSSIRSVNVSDRLNEEPETGENQKNHSELYGSTQNRQFGFGTRLISIYVFLSTYEKRRNDWRRNFSLS